MPNITALFPRHDGAAFDFDYCIGTHLPLVAEKWGDAGLTGAEAMKGQPSPDGKPPAFVAIAVLRFGSADELKAAMTGEAAAAILGDIANFTDIKPIVQINEQIG